MKNNRHFTDALFEEFDYFNDEINNILTEDLDTMLKYYNNLQNWDKQKLLNFLTKDPTWNNNKEQGQYSKWILDKLNRNLLNSSHLGHLHDVLKRFEDNKKYLLNKDINKFKSIQEIDTYLNDDNNYNELSHSQIVRQHRRDKQNVDLDNEAKLIYRDSDWEIWIPLTYAASCKLGQGSKWCTASTETSEYFDDYSSEDDLYIILNKHNEKEKYQFHVESDSYMDINDEEINLLNFCKKDNNKKWINALRQYYKYFDKKCEYFEKLDDLSQKINSLEIIKYPAHKDIIEDFKKSISNRYDLDYLSYLMREELNKIKSIKLEIENSVEKIEPDAFNNVPWITQVFFEKNSKLRSIGDRAFNNCYNIPELVIPDSVTEIGEKAFNRCFRLKNINLPSGLSTISKYMFYDCRNLKKIIIPKNVKVIDYCAFAYCMGLESVEIPDGVTIIGESVFESCYHLKSVTIPKSVTSIGNRAFHCCSMLLVIKTSNPYVIDYCIENNIKYEKID